MVNFGRRCAVTMLFPPFAGEIRRSSLVPGHYGSTAVLDTWFVSVYSISIDEAE